MLSKWTKSSGSSSSSSSAHTARSLGLVRACVRARTLASPLSRAAASLLSSLSYSLNLCLVKSSSSCVFTQRLPNHSARLSEAARSLYSLQIAGFSGWGKQLQAIHSFINGFLSFTLSLDASRGAFVVFKLASETVWDFIRLRLKMFCICIQHVVNSFSERFRK